MREISRLSSHGESITARHRDTIQSMGPCKRKEIKYEKRSAARRRHRRKSYARYHCPAVTQIRCLSLNQSEK